MLLHPVQGYAAAWATLWQSLAGCRGRSQAFCLYGDPAVCKMERCPLSMWCGRLPQMPSGVARCAGTRCPSQGRLISHEAEIHPV